MRSGKKFLTQSLSNRDSLRMEKDTEFCTMFIRDSLMSKNVYYDNQNQFGGN